jgi:hypothetical protein
MPVNEKVLYARSQFDVVVRGKGVVFTGTWMKASAEYRRQVRAKEEVILLMDGAVKWRSE